ncbi:MAG: repressor LexA [Clostridia bacterium]|nr:repressor LexA [Clostridia bacterium]MBR3681461.1 repressor LexA [Clostridia bacterium]
MKKMNEQKLDKMLSFIKDYIARNNGRSPKFSEILEYMEMTNSVGYRYLTTLAERGEIVYNGRDTLSIAGQDKMRMSFRRVPILGGIPCGLPEEHSELIEGYLALPEEWLGGDCYLLRADGDSMTGAGIDDGDLVLIRRTTVSETGRVIVALVDGTDTTLKRYFVDKNGAAVLHAENPAYRDLHPFHLAVQGVAVKVIKDVV